MGYFEKKHINIDSVWNTIATNVEELCKLRGISMHEVCDKLGVSDGYMKRNRDDIPVTRLLKLGEIFDIDPEKLWDDKATTEIRKMSLDAEIERLEAARKALEDELYNTNGDTDEEKPLPFSDC